MPIFGETMRKIVFISLFVITALVITGCSPEPKQEQLTDDLVATQVSLILTETAIQTALQQIPTHTETLEPSSTPEEEPTVALPKPRRTSQRKHPPVHLQPVIRHRCWVSQHGLTISPAIPAPGIMSIQTRQALKLAVVSST